MAKRTDSKVDRKRKLEELKRQQRSKERRKTILMVGSATLVGVLLLGGVIGAAVQDKRKQDKAEKKAAAAAQEARDKAKAELKGLGVPASAASCDPVQNETPIPAGGNHVQAPVNYQSVPPTGGEHAGQTLPMDAQNFYERGSAAELVEQAVHNLEHGVVVAWYDSKLPDAEVEVLKKIAANTQTQAAASTGQVKTPRLLVMSWDRGNFAGDKHFVLTAWGHKHVCGKVSGEATLSFLEQFENKDAPESGLPV